MKYEETIQSMYDLYPSLFQTRWQALNQLFCVIGNGYDWINGELVAFDVEDYDVVLDKSGIAYPREEKIQEEIEEYFTELKIKNRKDRTKLLKDGIVPDAVNRIFPLDDEILLKRANDFVRGDDIDINKIEFYPLSEYSAIFTYPEDIKPDWLLGIKEVIELLLVHGHGYEREKELNEWQKSEKVKWDIELKKLAEKLQVSI
jgi:hypothetical protein